MRIQFKFNILDLIKKKGLYLMMSRKLGTSEIHARSNLIEYRMEKTKKDDFICLIKHCSIL
jgi:hypothetical protein